MRELENWNFNQLVREPTHIQGGLIDHCYMSDNISSSSVSLSQKSVYYTDHDINELIIKKKYENLFFKKLFVIFLNEFVAPNEIYRL